MKQKICFTKGSIFVKVAKSVGAFFKDVCKSFNKSVTYKALCGTADKISNLFSKSALHKGTTGENIEENAQTSVFYTLLSKIQSLVLKVSSVFLVNTDKIKGTGIFARGVSFVGNGSCVGNKIKPAWNYIFSFTGIFSFLVAIIFLVPDQLWNNVFGLGISLLLLILVFCAYANKRDYVNLDVKGLPLSFVFFVATTVAGVILSRNRADSIRIFAFFLTSFIICVAIKSIAGNKTARRKIMAFMYFATIVTSIVAVVQGIIGVEADASLTDLTLNKDMPGRVFSTLGNPNNFAEFLVMFLPFSFVFALTSKKAKQRALRLVFLALPVAALLLTYSRSGWLAFALSVIVFIVLYNKRLIPLLIVAGIVLVPFLPESIMSRILTIGNLQDSSSSYRIDIWAGCVDMLRDFWVTGVGLGPGAFTSVYPPYSYGVTNIAPHSHMQFMEMLIETGIVGFASYIWFMFELVRRSCIYSKKCIDKETRFVGIACASSISALILVGLFEYCWFYPRVMFAFFVCAGIALSLGCEKKNI